MVYYLVFESIHIISLYPVLLHMLNKTLPDIASLQRSRNRYNT